MPGLLLFALLQPACARTDTADGIASAIEPETVELTGGLVWTGEAFAERSLFVSAGTFRTRPAGPVDRVEALDGLWVVPGFAEGHTHTIVYVRSRIADFLEDGIFYGLVLNADHTTAVAHRDWFNRPDSVDLSVSVAAITDASAHPVQIGLRGDATVEDVDRDWITVMENQADLEHKWPRLAEQNPDIVKIFLLYSSEYETRRRDPAISPRYRGMNPALVPEIVDRAHAAGLRVAAHVRTANDLHVAVDAGVDLIAHLPGFSMGPFHTGQVTDPDRRRDMDEPSRFRIAPADARRAAELDTAVLTTIGSLGEVPTGTDREGATVLRTAFDIRRQVLTENLTLLRNSGVRVLLGSDAGEGSVVTEALVVHRLGVFPPAELVRMLTTDTAQAIFPTRKIGRLEEGYEASFVALGSNPLVDLDALNDVRLRFKQGRLLTEAEIASYRE